MKKSSVEDIVAEYTEFPKFYNAVWLFTQIRDNVEIAEILKDCGFDTESSWAKRIAPFLKNRPSRMNVRSYIKLLVGDPPPKVKFTLGRNVKYSEDTDYAYVD